MTQESYERELGGIHAQLKVLTAGQESSGVLLQELRTDVNRIVVNQEVLTRTGCAVGREQGRLLSEHTKTLQYLMAQSKSNGNGGNGSGGKTPSLTVPPTPAPVRKFSLGPLKLQNYTTTDVLTIVIFLGLAWLIAKPYVLR